MAASEQGNQIQFVIRALLAAKLLVVDLQVLSEAADLALPAIAAQYLFTEFFRKAWDQGANAVAWVEFDSRCLPGHLMQKSLPLFARKELEESCHGLQE
jgi:hypothetical protein